MSHSREIINIDLSQGIPNIQEVRGNLGGYIIAWWKDIPLGHVNVDPAAFPIAQAKVATLFQPQVHAALNKYHQQVTDKPLAIEAIEAEPLSQLESALNQFKEVFKRLNFDQATVDERVSIVIPTMNRPEHLTYCLDSLTRLNHQPHEIIVVDNDPTTNVTPNVVKQFNRVQYLAQPVRGASAARNLGAQHCSGEIIAFVDDDERVDPNWLVQIVEAFKDPDIGATSGLVLPGEIETKSQDFFETRFSFVRGYQPRYFDETFFEAGKFKGVPVWEIGGSGNMAVRREIFLNLGGFDERLGGGHAGCSEDTEFFYKLLKFGWQIAYNPRAICYHFHRSTPINLQWQIFSYMRGHVVALLVQFIKYKDWGNLNRLLIIIPLVYLKFFGRSFFNNPQFPFMVLRLEVMGCLSGIAYFFKNRSFWLKEQQPLLSKQNFLVHGAGVLPVSLSGRITARQQNR